MKTMLTLLLLISTFSLFSQIPKGDTPLYYKNTYLSWGKYTYPNNLSGLTSFMTDLEKVNEDLYNNMLPDLESLTKRQRLGKKVALIGGGVGLGFILHGFFSGWVGKADGEKYRTNYATLTIGGLITTGSLIFGNTKRVKSYDLIYFSNRFNQLGKGDKLRFGVVPVFQYRDGLGGGLALGIEF